MHTTYISVLHASFPDFSESYIECEQDDGNDAEVEVAEEEAADTGDDKGGGKEEGYVDEDVEDDEEVGEVVHEEEDEDERVDETGRLEHDDRD